MGQKTFLWVVVVVVVDLTASALTLRDARPGYDGAMGHTKSIHRWWALVALHWALRQVRVTKERACNDHAAIGALWRHVRATRAVTILQCLANVCR